MTRLEYGVQLRPHHVIHVDVSRESAQAKVDESHLSTAVVMVREHHVGEWMQLDYYERYAVPRPEDSETDNARRRRLYEQEQLWKLRGEVFRLRTQLNTEFDSIPLVLIRDLPTEWRTMTSLKVDDVARELENIILQRLERHTIPRVLPEARVMERDHGGVTVKVKRYTKTFESPEHAMAHLAMVKAALAEFERREKDL
ncbi:MAG: hypothetical protein EON55_22820 [Alphaproteobacteria bacterium]|nr:MAG: hypothetical protein EON55_22820 [Alphaproteobacteria bacterium]